MSLTGKFYLWDDEEGFSTGEFSVKLTDEFYLLKADSMNGTLGFGMQRIGCLPVFWSQLTLFDSREELTNYLTWLDTPSEGAKPKIVAITKKPL